MNINASTLYRNPGAVALNDVQVCDLGIIKPTTEVIPKFPLPHLFSISFSYFAYARHMKIPKTVRSRYDS